MIKLLFMLDTAFWTTVLIVMAIDHQHTKFWPLNISIMMFCVALVGWYVGDRIDNRKRDWATIRKQSICFWPDPEMIPIKCPDESLRDFTTINGKRVRW